MPYRVDRPLDFTVLTWRYVLSSFLDLLVVGLSLLYESLCPDAVTVTQSTASVH